MVDQDKKEFVVNNHLTLRLEGGKTKIYVDGVVFLICKAIILNIPKNKIPEVKSMDDILEVSGMIEHEEDLTKYGITPLTEFWVHCSNLQIWAENDYNSDLLETKIAFPLMKRLSEVGDLKAKQIFKEEIARRYANGTYDTQSYLEFEEFLDYLTMEELVVGGLSYEESSLLLDIIDFAKQEGRTYEIVKSFDEDKVRHRFPSERFLTLKNGNVCVFEFDLYQKSAHLFNRFSFFKGIRNLDINLGSIEENSINFGKIKCNSMVALRIYSRNLSYIPFKIFECFPNLQYLRLYCAVKSEIKIENLESLLSLKKLKTLEFNKCLNKEHFNKLQRLKKKDLEIINI
ncbi:MAG: hypothetical protein ACFFG0_11400 [Candidatus Thorarchaeota archaeon]